MPIDETGSGADQDSPFMRVVPSEGDEAVGSGAPPPDVGWQWSYDRESVEQFMREIDAERTRLRAAIDAADERLEAVESDPDGRLSAARAELGAMVLAAHAELARIEREHGEAITAIREEALKEARRVLEAAREQAVAIRSRAALLAPQLTDVQQAPDEDDPDGGSDTGFEPGMDP